MLCTSFLPPGLPAAAKAAEGPLNAKQQLQRSASAFVVAAGVSCDLTAVGLGDPAAAAGVATTMSYSPPRTALPCTHTSSYTRSLTVPAYCLAGSRTRRRRRGAGGGGDDDGGWFGGGGGGSGDDSWGDEGASDGNSRSAQDLLLLWSLFCCLSLAVSVGHVTPPQRKAAPSPIFAALGLSASRARRQAQPAPHPTPCCTVVS